MEEQEGQDEGGRAESRRGRVRRLLLAPLTEAGMRRPGNVAAEAHAKRMARLCDELGYLSDEGLETLRAMLLRNGDGPRRDVWPKAATLLGWAQRIEPRPVEEVPALLRWFASVEGPRAEAAGTLVETWEWFGRHHRPPIGAERMLLTRAQEARRRIDLVRERMARGTAAEEDVAWLHWYGERLAYCRRLVARRREPAA